MEISQILTGKYKAIKQRSINKKELRRELIEGLRDGKLTADEIGQLEQKKLNLG